MCAAVSTGGETRPNRYTALRSIMFLGKSENGCSRSSRLEYRCQLRRGAALAEKLAGPRVVVNYSRSEEAANVVVSRIGEAGGQVLAIQADVSEEADCEAVSATIERLDNSMHW